MSKYSFKNGPLVSLITDSSRMDGNWRACKSSLMDFIACAAEVGIDLIQIREETLSDIELFDFVECAVKCSEHLKTKILVNDRIDIALAAGAGGVHLKESSVQPERVREIIPEDWVVGLSVHQCDGEFKDINEDCVDYVAIGNIFETDSKVGKIPLGVAGLTDAVKKYSIPVLGIGGINLSNLTEISRSGASGFSAIGLFASFVGSDPKLLSDLVYRIKKNWG